MRKKLFSIGILLSIALVAILLNKKIEASNMLINQHPIATLYLSTGEEVKIELYPEEAPNTVNNFIYLVENGFYEDTYINRIIPGYLVQGGDPLGNGYGFPGYFIATESRYNGTKNKLSHTKGTVSMARSDKFDTEGSQFFILLENKTELNGQYAAFGRVIEGLQYIEALQMEPTNSKYQPTQSIFIEKIEVETYGVIYEEPEIISVN